MTAQSTDPESPVSGAPSVAHRPALRYAGIHMRLAPEDFTAGIDAGFPELFSWLAARRIAPAGAPLIRYYAMEPIDGADDAFLADLDLGVPIGEPAVADGWAHIGELPAGRWVSTIHRGHVDGLRDATSALGTWSREQGLTQSTSPDGCILGWAEHYLSDPGTEPDPSNWRTEIAVLVD